MFSSLFASLRIVHALAIRDLSLLSRKSIYSIFGPLSFAIQPLVTILFFLAIRSLVRIKFDSPILGLNSFLFLASGCIPYFLFRRTALFSLSGIRKSSQKTLLAFPQILPIDLFLAQAYLNLIVYGGLFLLITVAFSYFQWQWLFNQVAVIFLSFLLVAILAFALSIILFFLAFSFPILRQSIRLLFGRVLFWTSGLFFSSISLPSEVRQFFLYNPLLHAIELIRHSLNTSYPIPDISLHYLVFSTALLVGIAFFTYYPNQDVFYRDRAVLAAQDANLDDDPL